MHSRLARSLPIPALRTLCAAGLLLAGGASSAALLPGLSDDDLIFTLQDAYARSVKPGEQAAQHRELLATVLQRIKRHYATPADLTVLADAALKPIEALQPGAGDPAEVFKKSVNAALATLDNYSRYLDPRAQADARSDAGGSFGGLGLEVQPGDGAVRVVAPMPGSPAARAGVAAGDLIVRVDDYSLKDVPLADAIARMRGAPGTPVSLTLQRAGAAGEFTVSLTRDIIRRQVLASSMEGDVLVLRLSGFTGAISASLATAIAEASKERQPRALVLDLRGNPGGLLHESVKVADLFLGKGEIVALHGAQGVRQRVWQADADELLAGVPMVVLVNAGSASASELVADALQFNGRATVMGSKSFGKGSVQTTFSLGENKGGLKLTTSLYYGPSGKTVQRVGVMPDIELLPPPKDEVAIAAAAKLRVDPGRCTPLKASDPVLSCAIDFLQSGDAQAFVAGLKN